MGRYMHPRVTLVCVGCSESFVVRMNEAENRSYCSRRCYQTNIATRRGPVARKREERICPSCLCIYEAGSTEQKYCGESCWRKATRRETFIKTCPGCNEDYCSYESESVYCSRTCRTEYERAQRSYLSEDEYEVLLERQGGVCAICRQEETGKGQAGKIVRLALDHCHTTGRVRGLLCRRCNIGLGQFQDSIETLKLAIGYLETEGGWESVPSLRQHLDSF